MYRNIRTSATSTDTGNRFKPGSFYTQIECAALLCQFIIKTIGFAIDNAALDALVGKDDDDENPAEGGEEAPAAGEEAPAEKAQEEAPADKKPAGKKGKAAADAGDEFED